jgi:hypothetical protein
VWTPKRILLLAGGGALFLALFICYVQILGGIDGLPPLPPEYGPVAIVEINYGPEKPNRTDGKLVMAFGAECPELQRAMKIEAELRGLVLACDEFKIEDDGRVKLTPFSAAVFKERGEDSYPEINTIRSDEAYIRFDQPITNLQDVGNHKIVGAELRGVVNVVNNRRTPQKFDDLHARITQAPVFFDDQKNLIWTDGFVKLIDTQAQPEPTTVTAKGLELHLTKEKAPPKQPARPARGRGNNQPSTSSITGVEKIILHSYVEMHLWVDAKSGFPGSGTDKQGKAAPAKGAARPKARPAPKEQAPGEKSRVVITTEGPFTYDLPKDYALFESPPPDRQSKSPGQVLLVREHLQPGGGKCYDQLNCDRLELQFRRKAEADPAATRDNPSADREIDSARATARPGEDIKLAMDTENLAAYGDELIYHSPVPGRGPQTILRGAPLHAVKDAHVITARELDMIGADAKGEGQHGFARGPGQIDMLDRNSGAKVHQYHALWKDTLVVTKDKEGDQTYDLLTFTGDAAFIDDEHHQEMRGDKIQVWLEPPERQEPAPGQPEKKQTTAPDAPRQRPHKLEAFDHVTVRSAELNVRETEHLTVHFKDGPAPQLPEVGPPAPQPAPGKVAASAAPPPAVAPRPTQTAAAPKAPATAPAPAAAPVAKGLAAKQGPPAGPAPAVAGTATAAPAEAKKDERKPIDLRAHSVAAQVLRRGPKNDLQEVVSEGQVHVHQDGSKPEDKGVDIQGEMLNLVRYAQGDVLIVFGDTRNPAQLQLGDLYLVGPKVTINQKDNVAEVEGAGAMRMPSNTGLDGGPPKKAGSMLDVHWTREMLFNGKDADFHGGVTAYQDNGSLRCWTLQVTLDRVVSFKEGQKGAQGAKVERLVADRSVYVADSTFDEKGKLIRYERLTAQELTTDNQEGPTNAPGPGHVWLLQLGTPDPSAPTGTAKPAPGAKPPPPKKESEEMTLTRVDFQGRMFSNAKDKTRTTTFYDNVEVYHAPADNPDVKIDPDNLPKGGLYMKCERLQIYSKPLPGNRTGQYMHAQQNVSFRTPEFYGTAPVVKYNQPEDIVTFEGKGSTPVVLYRLPARRGDNYQRITGQTILYNRKTGVFSGGQIEEMNAINGR